MVSPPAQPVWQSSGCVALDHSRPPTAAHAVHRIAQRLSGQFTGRVTLLGPGRGLPRPILSAQPHAGLLESPIFLPIGLVSSAALLHIDHLCRSSGAVGRDILIGDQITVSDAVSSSCWDASNFFNIPACRAARGGAVPHDGHFAAIAPVSQQRHADDSVSTRSNGQHFRFIGACSASQQRSL